MELGGSTPPVLRNFRTAADAIRESTTTLTLPFYDPLSQQTQGSQNNVNGVGGGQGESGDSGVGGSGAGPPPRKKRRKKRISGTSPFWKQSR